MVKCKYTGVDVPDETAIAVGALIPGVKTRHYMAPSDEAKRLHKISVRVFHESEGNCNTCKHLVRVPHDRRDGFMSGHCAVTPQDHPYPIVEGVMRFHPDDPMHMNCYASRYDGEIDVSDVSKMSTVLIARLNARHGYDKA